jgi:hypothetical protein
MWSYRARRRWRTPRLERHGFDRGSWNRIDSEIMNTVEGKDLSVELDERGSIRSVIFRDMSLSHPLPYTIYEIDHNAADVTGAGEKTKGGIAFKLAVGGRPATLVFSSGKEVGIRLVPDHTSSTGTVGVVLPLPLETELHIPEYRNLGRMIDRDMPVGESYPLPVGHAEGYEDGTRLGFNFFLARNRGMWLRMMVRQNRVNSARIRVYRTPEALLATFMWSHDHEAFLSAFSSMEEAIADYKEWLAADLGVRVLRDNGRRIPEWVGSVKLFVTVDMMRSHWQIAHDFSDIVRLADELGKVGCPKNTILYLPGWNGAYDSTYPTYEPHEELGGERGFSRMMEALHRNGLRAMIHVNSWGLDPYHPLIDGYEKFARRGEDGEYRGWQLGRGRRGPLNIPLRVPSMKVPFPIPAKTLSFTFEIPGIPAECEALLTVGGFRPKEGRVRFTAGRRSVTSPEGWLSHHDEYPLPFPFAFQKGANTVKVELEETPVTSRVGWFRVRHCYVPLNPSGTWTYPILMADTDDPEWIEIFVANVESCVKKFAIDAVHVDATDYNRNIKIMDALMERLENIPLGGENFSDLSALGYWSFCQGARMNLLGYLGVMRREMDGPSMKYLPDRADIARVFGWANKVSTVSSFINEYTLIYPHLCLADSFVPTGKVCNTLAPRQVPESGEALWRVLRDSRRLSYIPGLRINFREYGLDGETIRAIREIASW